MNILALIVSKKNSKRLKGKNRLLIKKKTLVERTYDFAKKINFIKKIAISTDDSFFLNLKFKGKIIKIKRPKNLSTHKSKSYKVVIHALKEVEKYNKFNGVLLLQPTSPFRSYKNLKKGYSLFKKYKGTHSVVSVAETKNSNKKYFIVKNKKINKLNPNIKTKKLNRKFQVDGNFYIVTNNFLKKNKKFIKEGKTFVIIQKSKKLSLDIDTKKDYNLAKNLIKS